MYSIIPVVRGTSRTDKRRKSILFDLLILNWSRGGSNHPLSHAPTHTISRTIIIDVVYARGEPVSRFDFPRSLIERERDKRGKEGERKSGRVAFVERNFRRW